MLPPRKTPGRTSQWFSLSREYLAFIYIGNTRYVHIPTIWGHDTDDRNTKMNSTKQNMNVERGTHARTHIHMANGTAPTLRRTARCAVGYVQPRFAHAETTCEQCSKLLRFSATLRRACHQFSDMPAARQEYKYKRRYRYLAT